MSDLPIPRPVLLLSLALLAGLPACKTSFDKNIHKAKLEARTVKTTPPVSISVPKELVEDADFGRSKVLKSPGAGLDATLEVQVATDGITAPSSKEEARQKAGAKEGREIFAFADAKTVGVVWDERGYVNRASANVWRKVGTTTVYCWARVTYGGSLSHPDEKLVDDHGLFVRKICESIEPAK